MWRCVPLFLLLLSCRQPSLSPKVTIHYLSWWCTPDTCWSPPTPAMISPIPSMMPDDRQAVIDVQNAIKKWGRYALAYQAKDADLILLVRKGHVAESLPGSTRLAQVPTPSHPSGLKLLPMSVILETCWPCTMPQRSGSTRSAVARPHEGRTGSAADARWSESCVLRLTRQRSAVKAALARLTQKRSRNRHGFHGRTADQNTKRFALSVRSV